MTDLQNWIIAKPKSNSNYTEWFVKNKAANAPITFEEIVMVMIKSHYTSAKISHTKGTCSCAWRSKSVFTTTNKLHRR